MFSASVQCLLYNLRTFGPMSLPWLRSITEPCEFQCVGATSVLTWSAGEIVGEIKETQNLILILSQFLYGPQFPHLYTHEKIEFYVLSKVSFRTKTF